MFDMNIYKNTQLANHLEMFKHGNNGLKAMIEDLEGKNTDYTKEIKILLSSLNELIGPSTELEVQAEHLFNASK